MRPSLHGDQKGSAAPLFLLMCALKMKIKADDLRSVFQLNSRYSPFEGYANMLFFFLMWSHKIDSISS